MLAKSLWSLWNLWSLYGDVRRFNTTLPLSLFFFLRSLFGHCLALFVVCFYLWVIVLSSSRIVPSCLLLVVIMTRRFLWGASAWPPGPYACCFGWGVSSEAGEIFGCKGERARRYSLSAFKSAPPTAPLITWCLWQYECGRDMVLIGTN